MERGGTRLNFHTFGLFGNLYSQRRGAKKNCYSDFFAPLAIIIRKECAFVQIQRPLVSCGL